MSNKTRNPYAVVLAGSASLAIAMGVGRFAFTPIMPMMLHDGVLDLHDAGELATANYVGYLVGALASMLAPKSLDQTKVVRFTLVATALLTAMMAIPYDVLWIPLRLLAGVISAMGFVFTSGWCLAELSGNSHSIGSAIYTGPGAGIAASGLAVSLMAAMGLGGQSGWVAFAILSSVLSAVIWPIFRPRHRQSDVYSVPAKNVPKKVSRSEMPLFAVAYGLAGFGYIVTATYLPVIAKDAIPGSALLSFFWPLFGLAAVAGSLLAAKVSPSGDARLYLIASYLVQASGVTVSIVWHSASGLALSSVLVGLPFTAISFFAMNEVRRIRSMHHARYMGLLTAVFAVGQILGPPIVGQILSRASSVDEGFAIALGAASIALAAGAVVYVAMILLYPVRSSKHGPVRPCMPRNVTRHSW